MGEKIEFERGKKGQIVPTLRNRELADSLMKYYGGDHLKVKEVLGEKNVFEFFNSTLSDPRQGNIFYTSQEHANESAAYAEVLNEMDRKYLESKNK